MQIQEENFHEILLETLTHATKCGIVQEAVIGDEPDYSGACTINQ